MEDMYNELGTNNTSNQPSGAFSVSASKLSLDSNNDRNKIKLDSPSKEDL